MDYQRLNHPVILDLTTPSGQKTYRDIHKTRPRIHDHYLEQIHELFRISHPKLKNDLVQRKKFLDDYLKNTSAKESGNWIYIPWKNSLIHLLNQVDFFKVTTARNKPLITASEQKKFRDLNVGIIGLSVGNAIALSLTHLGGANTIKLADPDTLELSNLNRIRASVLDLGLNKSLITARQIYEINPYANITIFEQGVNGDNLEAFLNSKPKLDLIIDECDDILLKFNLRSAARNQRIPLLMVTDNGWESNVDLIRFDLTKNTGGMKNAPDVPIHDISESLKHAEPLDLNELEELKLIASLIGAKNFSPGMQKASYLKVKKQIAGWPQLASTVFLGGALASYISLQLSLKNKTYTKTKTFSFPNLLNPQTNTKNAKKILESNTKKFINFITKL